MWDLWWTKWKWNSFNSGYCGLLPSAHLHQCSVLVFAWETARKQLSFRCWGTRERKYFHLALKGFTTHTHTCAGCQPGVEQLCHSVYWVTWSAQAMWTGRQLQLQLQLHSATVLQPAWCLHVLRPCPERDHCRCYIGRFPLSTVPTLEACLTFQDFPALG